METLKRQFQNNDNSAQKPVMVLEKRCVYRPVASRHSVAINSIVLLCQNALHNLQTGLVTVIVSKKQDAHQLKRAWFHYWDYALASARVVRFLAGYSESLIQNQRGSLSVFARLMTQKIVKRTRFAQYS